MYDTKEILFKNFFSMRGLDLFSFVSTNSIKMRFQTRQTSSYFIVCFSTSFSFFYLDFVITTANPSSQSHEQAKYIWNLKADCRMEIWQKTKTHPNFYRKILISKMYCFSNQSGVFQFLSNSIKLQIWRGGYGDIIEQGI